MNDNLQPEEYINARERFMFPKKDLESPIDEIISKIVGKKIYVFDPRLIKLVVKWKKGKLSDSMENDNFLQNPLFIKELKEVLNQNL